MNGALSNGAISSYRMDSWVRRSQQGQSARVAEDMSQRGLPLLSQHFLRIPGRDINPSSDMGLHPGLAIVGMARGRSAVSSAPWNNHKMNMEGNGENGGGGKGPKIAGDNSTKAPSGKGQAIASLLRRRLQAVVEAADKAKSQKKD